jgi:hypothetical protein
MSAHERQIKPTWLTLVYNKATPTNLSLPLNSNLGEWNPKCNSWGIHTDLNPPKKMPRALMLAWVVHIEKPRGFTLAQVSHFKTPKGFKPAWDFMSNCQDNSLAKTTHWLTEIAKATHHGIIPIQGHSTFMSTQIPLGGVNIMTIVICYWHWKRELCGQLQSSTFQGPFSPIYHAITHFPNIIQHKFQSRHLIAPCTY